MIRIFDIPRCPSIFSRLSALFGYKNLKKWNDKEKFFADTSSRNYRIDWLTIFFSWEHFSKHAFLFLQNYFFSVLRLRVKWIYCKIDDTLGANYGSQALLIIRKVNGRLSRVWTSGDYLLGFTLKSFASGYTRNVAICTRARVVQPLLPRRFTCEYPITGNDLAGPLVLRHRCILIKFSTIRYTLTP